MSVVRLYPGPPRNCGFRIANCGFEILTFRVLGSDFGAGWSSPVARWAHNPKVAGSNPAPATNLRNFGLRISDCEFEIPNPKSEILVGGVAQLAEHMVCNHGVRGSTPLTSTMLSAANRNLSIQQAAPDV